MAGGEDWIILTTSGRSTLVLAKTLEQDGYGVWTPSRTQTIRVPRKNVKRDITLPLLPGFLFARSAHMIDLLQLAKMEMKPRSYQPSEEDTNKSNYHRSFTVFRYLDKIPLIADRHLEALRGKERDLIPKKDRARFDRGTDVRVNGGVFEGLKGRVERCRSGYALVIFNDWKRPAHIPVFLLAEDPFSPGD